MSKYSRKRPEILSVARLLCNSIVKDDTATNHANKDYPEDCIVIVQILNERCLQDGKIFEVRIDTLL